MKIIIAGCLFSHSRKQSAKSLLLEHDRLGIRAVQFPYVSSYLFYSSLDSTVSGRVYSVLGNGSSKDISPFMICFAVWGTSRRLKDHCPLTSGSCTHYVTCAVRGVMPGLLAGERTEILISIQQ